MASSSMQPSSSKGPLNPRDHFTVSLQPHCTKDRPHLLTIDPTFGDGQLSRWPQENDDMTLLKPEHEKHVLWRRTAGDHLAKELGVFNDHNAQFWILDQLPMNYALFEQVTHPKPEKPGAAPKANANKIRLDRFVFGHNGRKIRSALSLGKHIAWLLHGSQDLCTCDGCKIVSKAGAAQAIALGLNPITAPTRASPGTGKGKKKRKASDADAPPELDVEGNHVPRKKVGPSKLGAGATAGVSAPAPPASANGATKSKGKGKGKGSRNEWEEDGDEEVDFLASWAHAGDYEEEPPVIEVGSPVETRSGSPGRSPKPSSKPVIIEPDPENDQFARNMKPSHNDTSSADSTFPERRLYDLEHPQLPRQDELVWCRVPVSLEEVEPKRPDVQRFTHWPAIVRERELVRSKRGVVEPSFEVEFLAINQDEYLMDVPSWDLVPWLGFAPVDTTSLEKKEAVEVTWSKLPGIIKERRSVQDILTHGFPVLQSIWLAAYEAGQHLASIQIRSIPTIGTGSHLIPNPDAPAGHSALRSLYLSRPTARHLTYSHIHLGPELIHSGDIVRLIPAVELPPSVARHVTEKTASQLSTSLVLQISTFIRGGRDCPLLARGRVYEMYEVSDGSHEDEIGQGGGGGSSRPPPIAASSASTSEYGSYEDTPADHAALRVMPFAFPAHSWRLLTPGREVDLLVDDIAGRYYPLPPEMMEDEREVLAVAEKARRTGVMGEVGIKALGLLLGGMVSGARVPRISAPHSLAASDDVFEWDDRSCREKDVEYRLHVANEQGFIASGLYIPPLPLPNEEIAEEGDLHEGDAEGELDLF